MASILLVNPRRRKRRKLSAKQRKYFGKRKRRSVKRVARRRRRSSVARVHRRRRRSSVARVHRRRRSNPSMRGVLGQLKPTIKAGLIGAAGGLGLDLLLGYIKAKLPAQLQSGYGLTATKILGAVGIGMLGNLVLRGRGGDLARGAMTVVLHDELKALAHSTFPGLQLGEYVEYAPSVGYSNNGLLTGAGGVGEYGLSGVGEYMSDSQDTY